MNPEDCLYVVNSFCEELMGIRFDITEFCKPFWADMVICGYFGIWILLVLHLDVAFAEWMDVLPQLYQIELAFEIIR